MSFIICTCAEKDRRIEGSKDGKIGGFGPRPCKFGLMQCTLRANLRLVNTYIVIFFSSGVGFGDQISVRKSFFSLLLPLGTMFEA